jgi:hypothetical protein
MCKRFFLQDVSKSVTGIDLSHPILLPEDMSNSKPKTSSSNSQALHDEARSWRELEQLILALDSLEAWRDTVSHLEA